MEIKKLALKHTAEPDETRPFVDKGSADVLEFDEHTVGLGRFEPGWRWSTHVAPIAATDSCQAAHFGYCLAGRMVVEMEDGSQIEMRAGDIVAIPPGHDAWVVGDETCIFLDFSGMKHYAKKPAKPKAA